MNKNLRSSVVGSEIWDFGRMFSVPGFPPFSLYDVILQNLVSILVWLIEHVFKLILKKKSY